jgi:tetratricopeptide (TPR) repeat protein
MKTHPGFCGEPGHNIAMEAGPPPRCEHASMTPRALLRGRCSTLSSGCRAAMLAVLLVSTAAVAQEVSRAQAEHLHRGNALMDQGKFDEALAAYDEAAVLSTTPEIAYNRGLALYRLNRFAEAGKALQDALKLDRPDLEGRVKYNLGRCAHQAALAERDKLDEAMNQATRAVSFYKEASRLMPKDPDVAHNLAEAQRLAAYLEMKLKEQQEQKQEPPTSQPSSQPKDEPTSQPDEQPQPSSQPSSRPEESEKQDDGEQEQQQDESDEGDQENQQQQEPSSGQNKQSQKQHGQSGDAGEESQEAAQGDEQEAKELKQEQVEPMLQEARDQERQRREAKRARMMRLRGRTPVNKDW